MMVGSGINGMRMVSKDASLQTQLASMAQRTALSLVVLCGLAFLLRERILALDFAMAQEVLQDVDAGQWFGAMLATIVSFWAVGRYDGVVHQHLGTSFAQPAARRAGIVAIAISQTVGGGVVSGALVRWRMLRGITLWQATRLSLAVTLSFLGGWAVVTGSTLTILATGAVWIVGFLALSLGCCAFVLGILQPHLLRHLRIPNGITQIRLIGLSLIDTFAACAALYILLPDGLILSFTVLLPAFLLALGAGLVSGTPGGMGPFEITLLALLPHVPEATLLAAIMGWRLVYFVIPAIAGAAIAALGPAEDATTAEPALYAPSVQRSEFLIRQSRCAEAGLARQGELTVMQNNAGEAWVVGRTGHALVGMFDAIGAWQSMCSPLHAIRLQAADEGRISAIYKCNQGTAAVARGIGWHVLALGHEAVLNPMTFTLDGPKTAALRRKLRKADASGVTVRPATPLGAAERAAIARLWDRARKGERGFSMGRYCETYLANQLVIEAWQNGKMIAFASFHRGAHEWTLDLMRHAPVCPDGAMQAIVHHAIQLARAAGLHRLSLAAAGAPPILPEWLQRRLGIDESGLLRFKQMFAPQWQGRYLVAPSRFALIVAGLEIARAIASPRPLYPRKQPHDHLAENEFAPGPQAWHTSA